MAGLVEAIRVIVVAGAIAAIPSSAWAVTGGDLLRQCDALERGAVARGDNVRLPDNRDAAQCWFYMAAVQDFAATVEQDGGPSLIGSCPSPDTTRLDFIRSFNRYAKTHPNELGLRASALIVRALGSDFPCGAR